MITQDKTQVQSSKQYYVNESALNMRLNTTQLLSEFEMFLSGVRPAIAQDDKGKTVTVLQQYGIAKANNEGINGLMAYLTFVINPHTVQGNLREDRYNDYVIDVNDSLINLIFLNQLAWEISAEDIPLIISAAMNMVMLFASRVIDNGERDSYHDTLISTERGNTEEKQQKTGLFGFGGVR